jgi:hypothetical protein
MALDPARLSIPYQLSLKKEASNKINIWNHFHPLSGNSVPQVYYYYYSEITLKE